MIGLNRKINQMLNGYPCSDFLHSALELIAYGEAKTAYGEICHAIIRSGGKLTDVEHETWALMEKEREQE